MMMRLKSKWNDPVWDMKIENINYYDIEPSKAIYWLSGGDDEWRWGTTYKKNWNECSYEFQSEFGMTIISIIKNSKTLKDIRNGFKNHINIMELYENCVQLEELDEYLKSKNFIRTELILTGYGAGDALYIKKLGENLK